MSTTSTPNPMENDSTLPPAASTATVAEANPHPHPTEITVNGRPVTMPGPEASGLEIKEAAIAQGVPIKLDFVLMVEETSGKRRIVKDQEHVGLRHHEHFFAIPADDNS